MDIPSAFRHPASDGYLPTSPERVLGARPTSTIVTTMTSKSSRTTTESEYQETVISPQSSPTRRAKGGLFAEYQPVTPPNNKVSGFALPQSPSLPEINALRSHPRTNSDVQGLVKRFEHLDVRDREAESVERRNKHEAELRRAQIAREEAESDVKRLREELRRLKKDELDARERERKVGRRLEVVMEESSVAIETHASQTTVYEKELRKARKEAFKSSSAVVKLQEELKSTRNSLRITQAGFDLEKQKVQRKEQERFEAEYLLIPLQEQLDKLREKIRIVEEEKEALKTSLKEEEVARIAAEGMIALPASQDQDDDLVMSPRKQSPLKRMQSPLSDDKENKPVYPKRAMESKRLAEELEREKMRREHAEEMVDFMQMECTFRCCRCSIASKVGHQFALSLDSDLASGVEKIRAGMECILSPPVELDEFENMEDEVQPDVVKEATVAEEVVEIKSETSQQQLDEELQEAAAAAEVDRSLTMTTESPKLEPLMALSAPESEESPADRIPPMQTPLKAEPVVEATETTVTVPLQLSSPQTPLHAHHETTPFHQPPSIRTVTTTTTIPMHFTPISKPTAFFNAVEDAENTPPPSTSTDEAGLMTAPFDRAAALAAIEYRRGRAKSIADGHMTPRKQMLEGVKERRDISAPALGQKVGAAGLGLTKGPGSLGRGGRK